MLYRRRSLPLPQDMGALLSANLLKNNIPVEQAQELVKIMQSHKTLTTLCGLSGKETELNMSGKMRGAGDAIMLAPEIIDNGAMTSLDISNNSIGLIDIFPDGWSSKDNDGCAPFVHTDGRKQNVVPEGAKSSGVIAIANVIPDMLRRCGKKPVNTFKQNE